MNAYAVHTPVLKTERLTLRPPHPGDAAAIKTFYESERSQHAGGHVDAFNAFKNTAAILGHWQLQGFGLWAVTETGNDTILGMVGPFYPDGWPETELGWVLFDGSEGKGIAFEAAKAARLDAYDRLGWQSIVSYIHPDNKRSIDLAIRLGATLDPDAKTLKPDTLVYRHPAHEALS